MKKFNAVDVIIYVVLIAICFLMLYPFLLMFSSSISSPQAVMRNEVTLLPKGLTLVNYKMVFLNNSVLLAYWNSLKYTFVGTIISVFLTITTAYPLSKARFTGRRFFSKLLIFTIIFNGGIVPTYLTVKSLGLINTMWAVVLVGAISTWNVIITRTFFEAIPESLEEAAILDGCNDLGVLFRIYIPLSTSVIATITLFSAVAQWNNFFIPLMYINDKAKYPLQVFLRNLLLSTNMTDYQPVDDQLVVAESIKYTIIMVTTLPIITIYPFLQKYFVKGVMVGAVKG